MRKVILNLAVSLDGFIEGPKGEYDWCFTDQDYGMTDFFNRIDAIFFGRKSYELLMQTEQNPYPALTHYVFSNTLNSVGGAILVKSHLEEKVKEIKNRNGKDIWLFGGAELTSSLLNLELVDELQLSIHPLLLGQGKPLFKGLEKRIKLQLVNTKTYSTGLVQVIYQLDKYPISAIGINV